MFNFFLFVVQATYLPQAGACQRNFYTVIVGKLNQVRLKFSFSFGI